MEKIQLYARYALSINSRWLDEEGAYNEDNKQTVTITYIT